MVINYVKGRFGVLESNESVAMYILWFTYELLDNEGTIKRWWACCGSIYQKINQKQFSYLVICYKLLMLFFPSDKKETNQILIGKTWKYLQLLWDFSHKRSWSTRYFSMMMGKGHNSSSFLEGWSVITNL